MHTLTRGHPQDPPKLAQSTAHRRLDSMHHWLCLQVVLLSLHFHVGLHIIIMTMCSQKPILIKTLLALDRHAHHHDDGFTTNRFHQDSAGVR